jgi:hypothetical protein
MSISDNRARAVGGIVGVVLDLIFIHYWFHTFSEMTSTLVVMAVPLIGERVAAAIGKRWNAAQ